MRKFNRILLFFVAILMCGCGKTPTPQPFVVDVALSSKLKSNYLPQDIQQLYYPIFDAQKNIIFVSAEYDAANDSSKIMNIVTAKEIIVVAKYDWFSNIRNKISGKPTRSTREGATKKTLKTLDCSELAKGDDIPDTEKCSRLTDFINQQQESNDPKYDVILYYSENQKITSWNGSLIYHTTDSIRTAILDVLKEKPKSKFLVVYNPPSCYNPIPVKGTFPDGITFNKTLLELENTGSTERLKATVYPDTIPEKNKKITWQSGDETVAKVDSNGVITATTNNGSAIISAYTINGHSATCSVTIGKMVTGITFDKPTATITKGSSQRLKYTISPDDATNKNVVWQSDNSTIATVDSTGFVKAVAAGTVNITVTTEDGGKTDTCKVVVKERGRIYGTIPVPGGIYKGDLLNGKPDGQGTIFYNSRTLIDSRDMKKRYAEAGQSLTGKFDNGLLLQGFINDGNGNHIEAIIIGGGAHK